MLVSDRVCEQMHARSFAMISWPTARYDPRQAGKVMPQVFAPATYLHGPVLDMNAEVASPLDF
jgi:hypothetical protein